MMLRKTVKELGNHSFIYLLGSTASAFASILLLPVYTRFLSKADYGILEIIDSARYLLVHILLVGFMPAMTKFYKEADSENTQKDVISTSLWCIFCSALIWAICLYWFDKPSARALLGGVEFVAYIDLGITLLFIQVVLTTGNNYLYIRKKSTLFLAISLSRLGMNIAVNLYCLMVLRLGAKGMLYGELFSTGIIGILLVAYLMKQNGVHFRVKLLGRMLKFGLPFVPNMLSAVLMHRVDRYLLQKFTSLSAVGIYGLGYRFPFMLNSLLLDSFGRIWYSSVMYEVAKQKNSRETYAKVTTYFMTIYMICQYILIVMAPTVMRLFAAPEYFAAWVVVQIIGLGLCFYSIYTFLVIGAYIKSKTWYLPISYLLSACINIVLNWYFLPRYGYVAAAWNTAITYFVFSFLNFLIFRKQYPIPFEFRRLGFLFGTGIILVVCGNALYLQNNVLEFIKECVFSAILPLIVLFGPYLDQDEKEGLREGLHTVLSKLDGVYVRIKSR